MKTLLVFVACLTYAAATGCGPLERLKVKSQWDEVYGATAQQREELGAEIWNHVFLHEPKIKEHLTRVRADNVKSHEFQVII